MVAIGTMEDSTDRATTGSILPTHIHDMVRGITMVATTITVIVIILMEIDTDVMKSLLLFELEIKTFSS